MIRSILSFWFTPDDDPVRTVMVRIGMGVMVASGLAVFVWWPR